MEPFLPGMRPWWLQNYAATPLLLCVFQICIFSHLKLHIWLAPQFSLLHFRRDVWDITSDDNIWMMCLMPHTKHKKHACLFHLETINGHFQAHIGTCCFCSHTKKVEMNLQMCHHINRLVARSQKKHPFESASTGAGGIQFILKENLWISSYNCRSSGA